MREEMTDDKVGEILVCSSTSETLSGFSPLVVGALSLKALPYQRLFSWHHTCVLKYRYTFLAAFKSF